MPKNTRNAFGFRPCKTIDQLHEALKRFQEDRLVIKEKVIKAACLKKKLNYMTPEHVNLVEDEIDFMPLDNFFFYLVLDNVKALFKQER